MRVQSHVAQRVNLPDLGPSPGHHLCAWPSRGFKRPKQKPWGDSPAARDLLEWCLGTGRALLPPNMYVWLILDLALITGHVTGEEGTRQGGKQHKSTAWLGLLALQPSSCHPPVVEMQVPVRVALALTREAEAGFMKVPHAPMSGHGPGRSVCERCSHLFFPRMHYDSYIPQVGSTVHSLNL